MTELFNLNIDYITIPNPIATSAMAGTTNAAFLNTVASDAGIATIGGISIDATTIAASKSIQAAGRLEFISDTPMELIKSELEQIAIPAAVVVNVRSATIEALMEAALMVKEAGGILEIDAHCQQEAMMDASAGQALLFDVDKLASWVSKIKKTGVVLSVKFRAGIVDDAALCCKLEDAGVDIVHIDAMIEGGGNNPVVIRNVRDATDLFIIANNSICDFESAKDMFSHGADMVSVARAMVANAAVVPGLVGAITQFQQDTGWYNAPKHICGGGDLRALAFCCLPVKPCAIHNSLKKVGLSAQEFADMKMEFVRGTPLDAGKSTCFGSFAWCCKITKPCFMRNGELAQTGLSNTEYSLLKKEMAEYILEKVKSKQKHHG